MPDLVQTHIDITSEVKTLIEPLRVVFPAQYGKLYLQAAQAQSIELQPDELFDSEMLDLWEKWVFRCHRRAITGR